MICNNHYGVEVESNEPSKTSSSEMIETPPNAVINSTVATIKSTLLAINTEPVNDYK